jgi:hypothetical protein
MRNDLNGFSQVGSFAFFVDYCLVNSSRGDVVRLGSGYVQEPFVVAQVQVGFCAVVGDVAFAMFIGFSVPGSTLI